MVSMSVCLSVCPCVHVSWCLSVCSFNQTRKTFLKGFDLTEADREGECASLSVRVSVLTNILIQV